MNNIIESAVDEFTESHPPDNAKEINTGYCRDFTDFLQDDFELPDGVEVVDAETIHTWVRYNGFHFDAEHPNGVHTANELNLWSRVTERELSVAINDCEYLDGEELLLSAEVW